MDRMILTLLAAGCTAAAANALTTEPADSLEFGTELDEVVVVKRAAGLRKLRGSAQNVEVMSSAELKRAACCNLGESFSTNPSVDVNYADAATGARQIQLLGLPGTYVQMLTENVPNLRGAASQFGLGYIPGPWMQSIQVSKGASSVKNGYESVTGQINIEMLKPQADQSVSANMYADHMGKVEANIAGNLHVGRNLSTGLLLHGENAFATHDSNNDGFADSPKTRQISAMNRWAYMGDAYIFQAAVKYLGEKRESGQTGHHAPKAGLPYLIDISTNRGEFFVKNACIFDPAAGANVALILSGSLHDQRSSYGLRKFDVTQRNIYASLIFERNYGERHALSAGLSVNADDYRQHYRLVNDADLPLTRLNRGETVGGTYAQYTFNLDSRLMIMGGVRLDNSTRYGLMFTPRFHARWNPGDAVSLHASAGKGYRSPQALADNSSLLASSRQIVVSDDIRLEEAWNVGGGVSGNFDLFGRSMTWSTEYYFTTFRNRMVADLDASPSMALIGNIHGGSHSHSAQVELTYELLSDLTVTAAYRFNDVRLDYGRGMVEKPLTSKSKGLITAGYTPMMGIWQFDATLALTGGGRMPTPRQLADGTALWAERYSGYATLNAQITRNFRHWAIYIGGENLTGYRQKSPVVGASDPWGPDFDATMVYGPLTGAMVYVGFRYNFTKY